MQHKVYDIGLGAIDVRPASDQEPRPYLESPVFSNCTVPVRCQSSGVRGVRCHPGAGAAAVDVPLLLCKCMEHIAGSQHILVSTLVFLFYACITAGRLLLSVSFQLCSLVGSVTCWLTAHAHMRMLACLM